MIKTAFADAHLKPHAPHSFRKTLAVWTDRHYTTREGYKALSQNIGHDSVITTVSAYLPASQDRQAELIRRWRARLTQRANAVLRVQP